MRLRAHAGVLKESVAVAGTRAAMMALVGVPYAYAIVALALSVAIAGMSGLNPFVFFGALIFFVIAARLAMAGNANRPREWWLALLSGSLWARRAAWGGERVDPLHRRTPEAPPCP